MDQYLLGPILGHGAYGSVYECLHKITGEHFAIKLHANNSTLDECGLQDATVREVSCLSALKGHSYVVEMHKVLVYKGMVSTVMTCYPYTLEAVIDNVSAIPLCFVARFSSQVASALAHMHSLNIIHRDLTPRNVMLTEDLTVKVGDMGLARNVKTWMSFQVCAETYRAPELFVDREPQYTTAIDMWSLGAMIADAIEGKCVFLRRTLKQDVVVLTTREIITQAFGPYADTHVITTKILLPRLMRCDTATKSVVFGLLTLCPIARLTAHELLSQSRWNEMGEVSDDVIGDMLRSL